MHLVFFPMELLFLKWKGIKSASFISVRHEAQTSAGANGSSYEVDMTMLPFDATFFFIIIL